MSKPGSGLHYIPKFLQATERQEVIDYLQGLYPIWEKRFPTNRPPPAGQPQRELLRPTYWLGNWQFACLGYYHPPKYIKNRSVLAEPYPPVLRKAVDKIENFVHKNFGSKDIPKNWKLNTCLINFYGNRLNDGKKEDSGRVGEHKDFEPGPIGSISIGDRALIQFVNSSHRMAQSQVVCQQWLEDSSLQVFGGDRFKKLLFHRVQRVEKKLQAGFAFNTTRYETRRVNFTFRYVPEEDIVPLESLPKTQFDDVKTYVQQLALHSEFWRQQLEPVREKPGH